MDEVYISQWDALNCFEDWEDAHGNLYYAYEDRTYQRIEKLPPADVRPVKRGHWTRVDYEPCGHDYICSECGCKSDGDWNFCHDCGADMRVEQVKEDAE